MNTYKNIFVLFALIIMFMSCEESNDYSYEIGVWNMQNDSIRSFSLSSKGYVNLIEIYSDNGEVYNFLEGGNILIEYGSINLILAENSLFKDENFNGTSKNRGVIYYE